jgi:uncharacterized membrane protein
VDLLKKGWVYVIAVVFGLMTTYFIYDFLTNVEKTVTNVHTEQVVVVKSEVAQKTLLTREV